MEISITSIKELRERSGGGVMDCRKALEESGGDLDKATQIIERMALASAEKRTNRVTGQGQIGSYIHLGGKIGALVDIGCETDFVARTEEFQQLVHDVAMQVAAMEPVCLSRESAPEGEDISDTQCLLLQDYIKDPSKTIQDLVTETAAKTGENIRIHRFARFAVGD